MKISNHIILQRFTDWARLKLNIHLHKNSLSAHVQERHIWWVSLGQNIGSEQNGKHKNFERPVLVLKRFNNEMFLAAPLSSQVKQGDYRFIFQRYGINYTANLSQIRVLSTKRLLRYIGKMDQDSFTNIKDLFQRLL